MNLSSISTQINATTIVDPVGGNEPFEILPPSYGMNFIICIDGLYPERS